MDRLRVCVIGGDGAIGAALVARLREGGADVFATTRRARADRSRDSHLDLAGAVETLALPDCDVVVLAAALTNLAACRADPRLARRINVDAPASLARLAARAGALTIFLSTNQVFDGLHPNVGSDHHPAPRSFYGSLKADAEKAVLASGERVAVVRLSKVIGQHLPLFGGWRRELANGRPVEAFRDLQMAPIAIAKVVAGLETVARTRTCGIWHLTGREDISYVDAARHLAARLGADASLVRSTSAADRAIPAEERPPHTALAPGSIGALIGFDIGCARTELDVGLGFADWSAPHEGSNSARYALKGDSR